MKNDFAPRLRHSRAVANAVFRATCNARGWIPAHAGMTVVLLGALAAQPAHAASCDVTAHDLQFGSYNSGDGAPEDSVSTVVVECVSAVAAEIAGYSIVIDSGLSGDVQSRAMLGAGESLQYNLFVDAARTTVWGDGSGGSITVGGELNLPAQGIAEHLLFGRIPPRQPVSPGIYGDGLTVRIEF